MRGRSTAVIGFDGSPHTFIARRKIPCMTTRYLWIVRLETVRVAFQRSMAPARDVLEPQLAEGVVQDRRTV